MSAAHVRRGSSGRSRPRKAQSRGSVSKRIASKLPVEEAQANKLAAWAFGLFVLAIAGVTLVALDVPAKVGQAAGEAVGDAGFRVKSVDVQGIRQMDPRPVYDIALDQKTTAMPLVDVTAIRERLLDYGWVKDARVSRRFPDTLVIDIVERKPAALWQDEQGLSLIDDEGVVLDRVPVSADARPAAADRQGRQCAGGAAPAFARQGADPEGATGLGEVDRAAPLGPVLPVGRDDRCCPKARLPRSAALVKFAKMDKSAGLLGRGIVRFDLRIPGKMTVRLPRDPGEPIAPEPVSES